MNITRVGGYMKKVSIIIPIYNGEKYIVSCLKNILNVDSNLIEIIIINDGSTDCTQKICNDICKKDKRVNIINIKNSGVSNARNIGIKKSTGQWLMFVDCDDVLEKNWFEVISKWFDSDKDLIAFSSKNITNNNKEEILDYIFNFKSGTYMSSPCSKLYRKEIIMKNNFWFESGIINGEDMLFNANYILCNCNYYIENISIYLYRQVIGSCTKKFDKKIFESDMKFQHSLEKLEKKYSYSLEKYIKYSKMNAIFMFVNRLSYASRREINKYKYILNDYSKNIGFKEILLITNKNKKIVILFIKMKLKKIIIFLLKFKNKINLLHKSRKKEIFINI